MSDQRKKTVRRRIVIAAIALPLLYILSSGPTQTLAFSRHYSIERDGFGNVGVVVTDDQGT